MNAVTEGRKVLLEIADLKVHFEIKDGKQWFWQPPKTLKAVDGVTLRLYEGETLGVVGESGCGKSTFARAIIGLVKATDGHVAWLGKELLGMKPDEWRAVRSDIQMIFQDPLASLNPRMTIGEIIAEPLRTYHPKMSRQEVRERVKAMMLKVGLLPNLINRYPHEFSGGQCQRIGIARALILEPKLIICDEPVSALDVSIQAQILNLLKDLQEELQLTYIFIAHGLPTVQYISDRIAVMYLGKIMELAPEHELFEHTMHPYTEGLLDAIPVGDPTKRDEEDKPILEGDLPSPLNLPKGCKFAPRCKYCQQRCLEEEPELVNVTEEQQVRCFYPRKEERRANLK